MRNRSILFAWYRATPPLARTGAHVSQGTLAEQLVERGYRVRYAGIFSKAAGDVARLEATVDRLAGADVPVRRRGSGGTLTYSYRGIDCTLTSGEAQLTEDVRRTLADEAALVVTSGAGSEALVALAHHAGARSVSWVHAVWDIPSLVARPTWTLCTSAFVRDRAVAAGAPERSTIVFYPPFRAPPAPRRRGAAFTLVNPIPEKGVATFDALAKAFPESRFLAVEGWHPVALPSLPNVTYVRHQPDLAAVFEETRTLLVPSHIDEAFGRVVTEAGLVGVPAIASARGGLAEAVGDGGLLVHDTDVAAWVTAVRLVQDPARHRALSVRARAHARRFLRDAVSELEELGVV